MEKVKIFYGKVQDIEPLINNWVGHREVTAISTTVDDAPGAKFLVVTISVR